MSLDASETLLQDFKRRSRRFRRRIRRRERGRANVGPVQPAQPDVPAAGNQIQLDVDLNEAINLGNDDSNDDEVAPVGEGDHSESDSWSHDRIDRGREMEKLERALLKENAEFHLHC